MKKLLKIFITLGIAMCILPVSVSAAETETRELSYVEIIEIADSYIEKDGLYYKITDEMELKNLLGNECFQEVEARITEENAEIQKTVLSRQAVQNVHIAVLKVNGNTVDSFWWGKRVKTYGRANAIKTRDFASAFSQAISDDAIKLTLINAGISYVPGFGNAATVVGVITGAVQWADARTWSTVSSKIANKIDVGSYYLNIDINAWNMDVQVYAS